MKNVLQKNIQIQQNGLCHFELKFSVYCRHISLHKNILVELEAVLGALVLMSIKQKKYISNFTKKK